MRVVVTVSIPESRENLYLERRDGRIDIVIVVISISEYHEEGTLSYARVNRRHYLLKFYKYRSMFFLSENFTSNSSRNSLRKFYLCNCSFFLLSFWHWKQLRLFVTQLKLQNARVVVVLCRNSLAYRVLKAAHVHPFIRDVPKSLRSTKDNVYKVKDV